MESRIRCWTCRDEGMPGGCPKCGKTPLDKKTPIGYESSIGVPTQFKKDLVWDSKILLRAKPEKADDRTFRKYAAILDGLYADAKNGIMSKKSLMIISDRGSGKHTFAYAMLKELSAHGFTTCMVFDHNEYLRLSLMGSERPYTKQRLSMDDIIYSDFVVMTIDPSNRFTAMKAIQSILMKRGHAGNPTLILSDYPLSMLATEKTKDIEIRYSDGLDDLRYCRIIRA